jgi:hypothetical protein
MLEKIDTFKVPVWCLPALINGDTSALSGTEENQLEEFTMQFDSHEGLVFEPGSEEYFSGSNDIDGLGGNVIDVTIHGHPIEGLAYPTDETRSYGPQGELPCEN